MQSSKHLNILNKGIEAWNKFRTEYPFARPNLRDVDFTRVDLKDIDLNSADLTWADLSWANLTKTILTWADLSHADLNNAKLTGLNLKETTLNGADLSGADLSSVNLDHASLIDANLSGAYLIDAVLTATNLSGANLKGARLSGATLAGTRLTDANLNAAELSGASFLDIDLSEAKGLDTMRHGGPSFISIDTIYKSKGKIPLKFLRGIGVPENFIEYMHSLVGAAFEYYSCFISYSTKDQDFATRIHADLQNNAVRCWFAPHDVQGGKKLHEQIDIAIRLHERLLLILSPDSINSEWVKTEIAKARKRETREGKQVLFPIRLNISFGELQEWECFDADTGKDSAREIREFYIPDFSHWKSHDQYQIEFKKLLKDLKKETLGDR